MELIEITSPSYPNKPPKLEPVLINIFKKKGMRAELMNWDMEISFAIQIFEYVRVLHFMVSVTNFIIQIIKLFESVVEVEKIILINSFNKLFLVKPLTTPCKLCN